MTSSPDLIHELRASRPSAPAEVRARVRAIAADQPARAAWTGWRLPVRRGMLVAVPAAAALALASAGVLGLARSDAPVSQSVAERDATDSFETYTGARPETNELGQAQKAPNVPGASAPTGAADLASGDRAKKVSATLTVEVEDSAAVSRAAQSALDLTQTLGGFVVSSSVATGDEASASITVRVPVEKVQDAIAGLSGLGRIVTQQVNVDDLQEGMNSSERYIRSLNAQIARITARLESEDLDAETEARLETRRKNLRGIRLAYRRSLATMRAEARMSTIQLTVATPGASGAVAPTSRIDRAIDEALNVLAWEGVVALGLLIVLAPFALVAGAVWLGHRLYRRHEEDRLLAT